ncbi:hypothetical protein MMC30_003128 [Trapelia coarctata]|nr:hypothetical protein [Trapelia coarctata]
MNSRSMLSPLSPQNTGSSTPSTYSSAANGTWTPSVTSYPASLKSDEIGGRPAWKQGRSIKSPQEAGSGSKPVIVSPGALSAGRSAASHGRLHKRGSSAGSTPQTAAFPAFDPNYQDLASPRAAYQDPYAPPSPATSTKSKVKIKPLLRKLSPNEKTSLDLSRTAAENEGLGIYTASGSGGRNRDGSDVGYNPSGARRGYHTRTMSGASQVSTTTNSSNHRPGAQYVHPMRQTPRPYTPPLSHSYQNSLTSSEISTAKAGRSSDDGGHLRYQSQAQRQPYNTSTSATSNTSTAQYAPLPSLKRTPPPLHIRTYSSSRLTNSSQTNLPGTPSSLRYADSFNPQDNTMPITARSSFDSVFRKRSRGNTDTDINAERAKLQALRAEFNAREEAKEKRIHEAKEKAEEKRARKKAKADDAARRKHEAQEKKYGRAIPTSEKSGPFSMVHGDAATAPMDVDLESHVPTLGRPRRGRTATAGSAGKAVASHWSLFWFKFKTLWLKFKKSVSMCS